MGFLNGLKPLLASVLLASVVTLPFHAEAASKRTRRNVTPVMQPATTPAASTIVGQAAQTLSQLETNLFGVTYQNEAVEPRLVRLEKSVFGTPQTGNIDTRISALNQAVAPFERTQQQSQYYSNTAGKSPEESFTPPPEISSGPVEQNPVLDHIEFQLFQRVYGQEAMTSRLDRIEQKIYGAPRRGAELADRVDALRPLFPNAVPDSNAGNVTIERHLPNGGTVTTNTPGYTHTPSYPPGYGGYPNQPATSPDGWTQYPNVNPNTNQNQPPPGYGYSATTQAPPQSDWQDNGQLTNSTTDMLSALNEVERTTLGKTYPMESTASRLARLEQKLFNQTAPPGVSDEARLQRIVAVAVAQNDGPLVKKSTTTSKIMTILPFALMVLLML